MLLSRAIAGDRKPTPKVVHGGAFAKIKLERGLVVKVTVP
jgi:hypothetical protein